MKDILVEKMYEWTRKPYQKYFKKNTPWKIDQSELCQYPEESLGFGLGVFLDKIILIFSQNLKIMILFMF